MALLIKVLGYLFLFILIVVACILALIYLDRVLPLSKPGQMDRDLILKTGFSAEDLARCSGVMAAEYADTARRNFGEAELRLMAAATTISAPDAQQGLAKIAAAAQAKHSDKTSVAAYIDAIGEDDQNLEASFTSIQRRISAMADCVGMEISLKARLQAKLP